MERTGSGKATTNTVVFIGSIAVIISDFFLTKLFLMFFLSMSTEDSFIRFA